VSGRRRRPHRGREPFEPRRREKMALAGRQVGVAQVLENGHGLNQPHLRVPRGHHIPLEGEHQLLDLEYWFKPGVDGRADEGLLVEEMDDGLMGVAPAGLLEDFERPLRAARVLQGRALEVPTGREARHEPEILQQPSRLRPPGRQVCDSGRRDQGYETRDRVVDGLGRAAADIDRSEGRLDLMPAEAPKPSQPHAQERLFIRARGCQGRQLGLPLQGEIRPLLIVMDWRVEVQMIRRQRHLARLRDEAEVGHHLTGVVEAAQPGGRPAEGQFLEVEDERSGRGQGEFERHIMMVTAP